MKNLRALQLMLAGACMLAIGCADAGAENGFGADAFDLSLETMTTGDPDPDPPPTGSNGDDPSILWASDTLDALEVLASSRLVQSNDALPSFPGLSSESRMLIRSAILCAMPEGSSTYDADTGAPYPGWWGLAPDWATRPLTNGERRWVSACMLQRLNAFGHRTILLEGNHPAVQTDASLNASYSVQEVTVYGDLFAGDGASVAYACWEDDMANTCADPAAALSAKICNGSPDCNLAIVGACSQAGSGWSEAIRVRVKPESVSCFNTAFNN